MSSSGTIIAAVSLVSGVLLALYGGMSIVGGSATPDKPPAPEKLSPSVVKISSAGVRCTAVKVTDHLLLTAAHCVDDPHTPPTPVLIKAPTMVETGRVQAKHPTLDIAAICAAVPVPTAKLGLSVPNEGDELRIGGFSDGVGWAGMTKVIESAPDGFVVDTKPPSPTASLPCERDSGSPAFTKGDDPTVVGIASKLLGGECGAPARYDAVAGVAEWVKKAEQACGNSGGGTHRTQR